MRNPFKIKAYKRMMSFILLSSFTLAFSQIVFSQKKEEWKSLPAADKKLNPLKPDLAGIAAGKSLYTKECFSCHGKTGKGDGSAAVALGKSPGDLSSAMTQAHTDGALLWKIQTGKPPMPSYQKKLSEVQVWQLINYIRTLSATTKK